MTESKIIDDDLLMARISARDQMALADLYDRYARILYTTAYRMLGSVEESEEVVLDVFNQVWRMAARFDPARGRADAWLFMITRSRALDRLRVRQRITRIQIASTEVAQLQSSGWASNPQENLLISERRDQVMQALSQIPVEQRQVIEAVYFSGLTQSEVAEQLGLAIGTVKTRIRLGLSKLRESLSSIRPTKLT